jgi:hypothetical protein
VLPRRTVCSNETAALLSSWQLALESANKNPRRSRAAPPPAGRSPKFLRDHDMPDVEDVIPGRIRAFVQAERELVAVVTWMHPLAMLCLMEF